MLRVFGDFLRSTTAVSEALRCSGGNIGCTITRFIFLCWVQTVDLRPTPSSVIWTYVYLIVVLHSFTCVGRGWNRQVTWIRGMKQFASSLTSFGVCRVVHWDPRNKDADRNDSYFQSMTKFLHRLVVKFVLYKHQREKQ